VFQSLPSIPETAMSHAPVEVRLKPLDPEAARLLACNANARAAILGEALHVGRAADRHDDGSIADAVKSEERMGGRIALASTGLDPTVFRVSLPTWGER